MGAALLAHRASSGGVCVGGPLLEFSAFWALWGVEYGSLCGALAASPSAVRFAWVAGGLYVCRK